MVRKTLSVLDYIQAGNEKNLKYDNPTPPRNVHESVRWVCKNCGEVHYKGIRTVRISQTGCLNCSPPNALTENDYHKLARKLKITFLGPLPPNNKTKTSWRGRTGNVVDASYHDLSYNGPKQSLIMELGIY